MKLGILLFFLGQLICFAQLNSSPMEKVEILDGDVLNIVPKAQSIDYSYFKKRLNEPLSGSEVFKKFTGIVSLEKGEEIAIFENHSSFSIKPAEEKINEFLLTCTYHSLSFNGGISFQQAIIRKNESGGTIVELIKDVYLTVQDSLKWEESGLSLEDFISSGKYMSVVEKSDNSRPIRKDLLLTPTIELPSGSSLDQKSEQPLVLTSEKKYTSVKSIWPWIGIGLLTLVIISLSIFRKF